MVNVEREKGDVNCHHTYVKRDKKVVSILTRTCTTCGRVEDVSDGLSEAQIRNVKGD